MKTLPLNLQAMLRVDQAGEYGAIRIYQGQIDVMRLKKQNTAVIEEMLAQEQDHLDTFNSMMVEHAVPATVFTPLWHVGGYLLGAVSALISEKMAHACTIAVEEVIEAHYETQKEALSLETDPYATTLKETFSKFQQDEVHHKNIAEEQGGREVPLFSTFTKAVKAISKTAIWLSEKI